jgi:signal transduction histidine kinase
VSSHVSTDLIRVSEALIAGALLCCLAGAGYAADDITTFTRAQFVLSDRKTPPAADANWSEVTLPHDWRTLDKPARLIGWYRITISSDTVPSAPQAVYLRHLRAWVLDLYVNGVHHVGSRDIFGPGAQDYGFSFQALVPLALWKQGENVLHFRMVADSYPRLLHGLGRLHVGPLVQIRQLWARDFELSSGSFRISFAATATAGLIALLLWLANRNDRVMFWFSFACLTWALACVPNLWFRVHVAQWILDFTNAYTRVGMPVPVFVMVLRLVDRRWPRVETALWLLLLLQCTFFLYAAALGPLGSHWAMRVAWPTASAAVLFSGIAIIARCAPPPLNWSHYLEMGALATMAALLLQDLARYVGWVDPEPIIIRHYHVPVMVLAIGLVIFERHVAALWRVQNAKAELEQRIAHATREIEANQQRIAAALHEQALARERQRILADMHDGLGASLIGLLRYVQTKPADSQGIEQRVREALQEMRIAIDALAPDQSDLATLLGRLRYRLEPLLEAGGARLHWEVAAMPVFAALEPSSVFAIQRAVLEALVNALKHSGAKHITLTASTKGQDIEIKIEDDGRGFAADDTRSGHGLSTMRSRARALGGICDIASRVGGGTTVIFRLPHAGVRAPEISASAPMHASPKTMPDASTHVAP